MQAWNWLSFAGFSCQKNCQAMSAERPRDALEQSLVRLSNRLAELSAWRDREQISLSPGEIRQNPNASWTPIRKGDFWPAQAGLMEIRFQGSVPGAWANF